MRRLEKVCKELVIKRPIKLSEEKPTKLDKDLGKVLNKHNIIEGNIQIESINYCNCNNKKTLEIIIPLT